MPSADAYRPLVAPPELQQDWSSAQEERSVTWPELFFDLFFVAAISNLSHLFKDRPDAPTAGRIVLYHALVFFIWSDYAMLKTRYRLRGLLFRCIGLCLQLGTLGLIIGTRDDQQWHRLLAGGYCCARAALSCAYFAVARSIPRARALSLIHGVAGVFLLAVAAAMAANAHEDDYDTFVGVFIGIAIGEALVPSLPSFTPQFDVPLHVEHMNERLGQLVMLHLGEAVIGFAASPLESTVPQFVGVALAATLVWSLHLCYYHIQPDQHSHAYRQSRVRGLLYYYSHWCLAVALLLTGSGLRLVLEMYPSPELTHQEEPLAPFSTSLMLCVAYAASLHLLALIRAAHFFSLQPDHQAVRSVKAKGVQGWWLGWWVAVCLWPLPVYFLPLVIKRVNDHQADQGALKLAGNQTYNASGVDVMSGNVHAAEGARIGNTSTVLQAIAFDGVTNSVSNSVAGVSVTCLLAVLAGHAVALTCAESFFAHKLTKTPILQGSDQSRSMNPAGPEQQGQHDA